MEFLEEKKNSIDINKAFEKEDTTDLFLSFNELRSLNHENIFIKDINSKKLEYLLNNDYLLDSEEIINSKIINPNKDTILEAIKMVNGISDIDKVEKIIFNQKFFINHLNSLFEQLGIDDYEEEAKRILENYLKFLIKKEDFHLVNNSKIIDDESLFEFINALICLYDGDINPYIDVRIEILRIK